VKQHLPLLAAACGLALSCAALAADEPPSADKIQAKLDALQKEIDALKETQQTAKVGAQEQAKVGVNYGRFSIASADGRNSITFRALVQADAAHYDQEPAGPLTTDYRRGSVGTTANRENNGARDLSDGAYFRRARFGVEGFFNRDFSYRLTMELGGAGTETQGKINDAWISYTGLAPFTFQIGAFTPPTNLDDGTSADDTTFLERGSATEISRALGGADGRIGIGTRANGTRWMGSLSYTGRTIADPEVYDAQQAVLGRAAFLALTSADYNVHVGAAGTYVVRPADQGFDVTTPPSPGPRYPIRFRDRPELRVDSTRLIDTGNIDASHAYVASVEAAGNWRNFQAQAENFWFGVDRKNSTASDPHFSGYYVQGSWLITGESRRYVMANGAYQAPRPRAPFSSSGGTGAFELALRFSHADFNFEEGIVGTAPTVNSVRGGEQNIVTVGINWYATPNVKFMFNYLRVDVDRINPAGPGNLAPFGAAPATPPIGVQIGQQYNAFAVRSQFNF
jgi:phosphate-selective porin OprO/OprP